MELHPASRINPGSASSVCERYLRKLPITPEQRQALLRKLAASAGAAEALTDLHGLLAGAEAAPDDPASASVMRRLALAYGTPSAGGPQNTSPGGGIIPDVASKPALTTAPPIRRTPMAPRPWLPRLRGLFSAARNRLDRRQAENPTCPNPPDPQGYWHHSGSLRRFILLGLVLSQTMGATYYFMASVLPYHGAQPLEIALLVLFAILCGWVSAGFWTAIMGFLVLQFGGDRYAISGTMMGNPLIDANTRTAIVMPICNENVMRVFAGLRATYASLAKTGNLQHFDFYVLSDSNDPDIRVSETAAWLELCRNVDGFNRIFYRWRRHRIKRKSGNIADFCRRWGGNYRYMVVMDADSVMTGGCLSRLVRLMEANPGAGIIQTAPCAAGRETLYARLQQFASRVYGPLFIAGLHYWQLGESHYWGHNAIIRVAPFIRHCALGRLPGRGPLSGEILSHDFVEAALMRRAGWGVWIAYDLSGSFEETPPNLVDELMRDRRWCHGNLINFRLFLAHGFHLVHRAVFVTGMIAYLSAFLWFIFLLLSTWLLAQHTLVEPEYFVRPRQLFPLWPEWHPEQAIMLFGVTATWLFLPKILSMILIATQGVGLFGGLPRLLASMLAEWLFSMLLAPIRMLFHTQFVLAALTGWRVQWRSPPRENAATNWRTALRRHGWHTLLGIVWALGIYWLNPFYLWWLMPIVGALMLSIPISVYSSSAYFGRLTRKAGFFLIPEEINPPEELRRVYQDMEHTAKQPDFIAAVTDPTVNALVCVFAVPRARQTTRFSEQRAKLIADALRNGPDNLSTHDKMLLLNDPQALSRLHFLVWSSTAAHGGWFGAGTRVAHPQPMGPQPVKLVAQSA